MNPLLESLLIPEGSTWTYFHRRLDECIPFNWHYHLEYELTLTVNSHGQRYVGDNIETYGDCDLVLLGSNLPHAWMSQGKVNPNQPHVAHVFWIRPDWIHALMDQMLELKTVKTLLSSSARGIVFSLDTARRVRELVEPMHAMNSPGRLVRLIEVLAVLAEDFDHRVLCAPRPEQAAIRRVDRPRIDRTLDFIHENYQSDISVVALADMAALSVSGFHRLFKRHTRLTVGEYITQLRIGKACALLVSSDRQIAAIADEVGYTNLSHFNRQFLAIKQLTPREFRRAYVSKGMSPSTAVTQPDGPSPLHYAITQAHPM
jgi:AraC-like DNA-binding protein